MTYQMIKEKWNKEADKYNQWDNLSEEEKIEWTYELGYFNAKDDNE